MIIMVSEFGKFCRNMRLNTKESLRTMAKKLEVSAAFLSAMEVGRKPIPIEYIDRIASLYNLSEADRSELEESVYETNNKVSLELGNMTDLQKDVSVLFARKIKNADPELLKKLKDALENEKD